METVSLKIEGMSCASCASTIEREVLALEGVNESSVNYAVETGKFKLDSEIGKDQLETKIKDKIISLGYFISTDSIEDFK